MRLPLAFLLVNVFLVAPGRFAGGGEGAEWVALEAVLLAAVFFLPQSRAWRRPLAALAALVVCGSVVLLVGDAMARMSLSRPLDLYLDWHLLGALWTLLVGMSGAPFAALLVGSFLVGIGLLGWSLIRLLGRPGPDALPPGVRVAGSLGLVAAVAAASVWSARPADEPSPPGAAVGWPAWSVTSDQVRRVADLLEARESFAAELESATSPHDGGPGLLAGLDGRTVLLAFVESYGVSTLQDERYAPVIVPRLAELSERTSRAGLHLATGALVAPTQGGQSWLSHASLLSGLWLDDQLKYDLLLGSDRETLVDDFRRAGYETTAVMPAITRPWPEGEWFGYDDIRDRRNIDYAGPPLNWVTMPDQFTWSFVERVVRGEDRDRPRFIEVGLVSSHAPWTPILPVLDWDDIGRGAVFARWEDAGERPEELWRDPDRVREHFARSVDYAVHTMTSYAERYVDGETLLIVLGDHQPAPLITGEDASRAVPVHVISGDPALIEPFLKWGFRPGSLPDPDREPPRMDAFRDWFVGAYSAPRSGRVR